MRTLGLDYGDRRIGVALSDELYLTAQALTTIQNEGIKSVMSQLQKIVESHQITEIVVGLPKNMNGTVGPRAELSIQFAERLKLAFKLPVHLWDERLTSRYADRAMIEGDVSRKKRKQVVDKMAAAILLQGFMDAKCRR